MDSVAPNESPLRTPRGGGAPLGCTTMAARTHAHLPRSIRASLRCLFAGLLALSSTGCVGTIYSVNALSASANLEEAKTLGAQELAQFEYYYARAMLEKAQEEAAEANYGDAIEFAGIADEFAEKAVEHARSARREGGR